MSVKFDFKTLKTGFEADWPVTVGIPQDGGTVEEQTFLARFKTLNPDETKATQDAADPDAWINAFLVGLGKDEPALTPELRAELLGSTPVRQGIVRAFIQFSQGAPAKN